MPTRKVTLFELVKPQAGGSWTFKTVAQMPASIGNIDIVGSGYRSVVFDKAGNLYGLATLGCVAEDGCGKIFKVPVSVLDGSKPKGKVKILYTFPYVPGSQPIGMVRDKAGNLFGVEYSGGQPTSGFGVGSEPTCHQERRLDRPEHPRVLPDTKQRQLRRRI